MKTIGLLFDVSGSMKQKFNKLKDIDKVNKKSDELIEVLKKIAKNNNANIFSILFGLQDSPYIIDFIKLLQMSNEKFKDIPSTEENSTTYRDKLIDLLSKDQQGNERYCNIREYVISENGPTEKLSAFFCNLMEEDRDIIDSIYNRLPKEVTNQNENQNLNRRIFIGRTGATVGASIVPLAIGGFFLVVFNPLAFIPLFYLSSIAAGFGGNRLANNRIENAEKEETIKAIKNSFKSCIEIITKKIINEYKLNNFENYELIKGENVSNLIEDISKKIIQPEENNNISIIDLFENIIYGKTPLYSSCKKAFEIFENNDSKNKILFIISDGLLTDTNNIILPQNEIRQKINQLEIITICIYLNSSSKLNNKTFYNEIQPNFESGAKFLFDISSELNYHNSIIKFFIKKNWNIPLNGVCNLFVEINNSEDLNQFINLVNEALNYNEPLEYINKVIGDTLLDKIIDENYIEQFNSVEQIGGRCWAYSLSAVIYLALSRIFGRKIPKFGDILNKILTKTKAFNDNEKNQGRNVFELAKEYLNLYKLRGKIISANEARKAVINGRPCLCRFFLDKFGWHNFSEFFLNNPKGILTKQIMNQKHYNCNINNTSGGHAVVLTSIEKNCLKFLNSWGKNFGDNGYFRIENEKVLNDIQFMDIFWYESDLTNEEINIYNNNYLSFIKQASNYLSNSNINIKEELEKKVHCLICNEELSLQSFELILHQNHEENVGKN